MYQQVEMFAFGSKLISVCRFVSLIFF